MAGALFVSEVFACSFYPTGRVIPAENAPAHSCATARNVGSHNQILLVRKLYFHELLHISDALAARAAECQVEFFCH